MARFQGSITALITPFKNGAVDEQGFQRFVEWQIDEGINGLVPVGTTGESPTLSHDEHKRVVELCVKTAAGRVPVIAGAGSNSTDEAIDLTRFAKTVGADGVLVVSPYYNRPSQEGVYQHFKAINDAVQIPILPASGYATWAGLVLPTVTVAIMQIALISRMVRREMTTNLASPYLTVARSRGVSEGGLTWRYAIFFLALAAANETARRVLTDVGWGYSKLAAMVAVFVFTLAQMPLILKHTPDPDAPAAKNGGGPEA